MGMSFCFYGNRSVPMFNPPIRHPLRCTKDKRQPNIIQTKRTETLRLDTHRPPTGDPKRGIRKKVTTY